MQRLQIYKFYFVVVEEWYKPAKKKNYFRSIGRFSFAVAPEWPIKYRFDDDKSKRTELLDLTNTKKRARRRIELVGRVNGGESGWGEMWMFLGYVCVWVEIGERDRGFCLRDSNEILISRQKAPPREEHLWTSEHTRFNLDPHLSLSLLLHRLGLI